MEKQAFKKLSVILAVVMIITAIAPLSAQAAYGDSFTVGGLEYSVDKEASGTNLGEVYLNKYNATDGDVVIPATVTNASNGNIYEVTFIRDRVFENKSITSVSISSTIKIISIHAFEGCASLTNVTFEPGSKLEHISNQAFHGCTSLVSIDLPDGLKTIDANAFEDCKGLKTIDIPKSVETINSDAFYNCSNLNEIIFNSPTAPNVSDSILGGTAPSGKIYYPKNGLGYDAAFFNNLFDGYPPTVPSGWIITDGSTPALVPPQPASKPVNMFADVPEADIPGFGRDFRVSGEITNAPGVPESVVLRVSTPSPEFTSNKAANAAYSDALLHGQPVAFNALEVVDAASGQAYVLPEGAKAQLKFGLGAAFADKAVTISRYDAAGELIERFDVTCDGDGSAVINASGLGLFVITREWL